MAPASSSWQQFIHKISEIKTGSPKNHISKHFSEPGVLLGLLTVIVAMLIWSWQLLLALVVGIGIMVITYSMQKWNWQLRWLEIRKLMSSTNSRLAYSIVSGGIATVITYMASAIWVDAPSHWLAAGAIVQGMGTLLTLILLVWQICSFQGNREEDYLDQLLNNLTEKDSLKRLISMRQLNKLITRGRVDTATQQDIMECLQLLLSQEKEVMIREAALDCLQNLNGLQVLKPMQSKVFIPVSVKSQDKIFMD
ncbi:armadillo-type fold-containing protein [Dolichospermum sp. ST_con]|nr:armadillo-type fold-containing protein [Dolichospermum sp. ST_con]MDD1418339.1 armadillo-type fold-containing protein [Dolichospermum sp. ST_sed1]MDD1423692.1 armadillo-type fold-containing protein [Dolichospermum sp. ST_sed9]MDD1432685.1 armadillo-type fold-containing protein [Dolichospermum sp. ST_sed6]MDD1435804.1 armadillo-type fold-containing protein [Dolichospermum sp. ST_sed10]MDD1441969.1 armadillo-type fold-containing protein [Dolichospermum sp. ST_sed3]MDD1447126.1 armadillo-type